MVDWLRERQRPIRAFIILCECGVLGTMNLAIYLLKQNTQPTSAIIADKLTGPQPFVLVGRLDGTNPSDQCYIRTTAPTPAEWANWLTPSFDLTAVQPRRQSSAGVILKVVDGHLFAVTFGAGRHALDKANIVRDFGLRVALNRVNPDQLRRLVSKTVDIKSRETSAYRSAGGGVAEFDMNLDVEWLRTIGGASISSADYSAVAGADAVHLKNFKKAYSELDRVCGDLLAAFRAALPDLFSFVENIRPLASTEPKHNSLEAALIAKLEALDRGNVEIVFDAAIAERFSSGSLVRQRRRELEEPTDECVWEVLRQLRAEKHDLEIAKVRVQLFDGEREPLADAPLLKFIQAELVLAGDTYVRMEGSWFKVSEDYIERINQKVQSLPNVTAALALPDWDQTAHTEELDYNSSVAQQKGWLLQDQRLLYPQGAAGASFEVCDLMTESAHLIHIKSGTSSNKLSHLLGQIGAAADLYANHDATRVEVGRRYAARWTALPLAERRLTFVAAVGRPNVVNDLLGKMLVTKLNILQLARRVRALNFDFAVAGFRVSN